MQNIFALGSNGSGQLGLGHTADVNEPTECLFCENPAKENQPGTKDETSSTRKRKVKRIACGGNHTLILFEDGSVYAAGEMFLDCAIGDGGDKYKFNRVVFRHGRSGPVIERFRDICATWSASFFVATIHTTNTSTGDGGEGGEEKEVVIALGTGGKGELGLGMGRTSSSPTTNNGYIEINSSMLQNFPPPGTSIRCIGSSAYHTVAILSDGEVYGWGAGRKGQLGRENSVRKVVWEPVRVAIAMGKGFVPDSVACGREFTFISGFVVDNEGKGEGEYMYTILGGGDKWGIVSGGPSLQTLRKSTPGRERYTASASWHGIYLHDILDNSGLAWGRNDRGQLGPLSGSLSTDQQAQLSDKQPIRSEAISQFVAGSEHAVALSFDNRTILACGWGEHGNCGPYTDEHGDVKGGRVCHIRLPDEVFQDEKAKVVRLAAGCATTWIVTS
ncbi:hypothetical protein UA08_07610 [Talaromyces atroroseus]|uniref:RCC1 repeat-containing protein n=1 Tax=Talaromyces atroroseus TaxID=1441469 RepID=A0A225ANX7_TALAT|nr:hypothetical protein UA08_07610 [Talaromyces atroroseus]OKL57299.1 hypothetical protein UA08_07610 [Talaromyces atroroseus]